MAYALLGDIRIGDAVWTGPTSAGEGKKAARPEHKVSRGKPVRQDMGDELDTKRLEFFFDETFCEPQAELDRLMAAYDARRGLDFVAGDGSFNGVRWVIDAMDVKTLKTTPHGRPVRMKITLDMVEDPDPAPLDTLSAIAVASASALTNGTIGVSVSAKVGSA